MKKYFSGLLTGIILCLSLTTFAAVELNVIPNPFKVLINGTQSEVEGYNINGSTFLKLADFKKAGLTVKFNETDKQIEVTSSNISTTTQAQIVNMDINNVPTVTNKPKITTYKNCEAIEKDGIIYVEVLYVDKFGFNLKYDSKTQIITLTKNDKTITFSKTDTNYCVYFGGRNYIKISIIE